MVNRAFTPRTVNVPMEQALFVLATIGLGIVSSLVATRLDTWMSRWSAARRESAARRLAQHDARIAHFAGHADEFTQWLLVNLSQITSLAALVPLMVFLLVSAPSAFRAMYIGLTGFGVTVAVVIMARRAFRAIDTWESVSAFRQTEAASQEAGMREGAP